MPIDKVTLEVLNNYTHAAAENMAYVLMRTAYTTFVKETQDFTTALATVDGEMFAYPRDHAATWFLALSLTRAIKKIPNYQEGDICMSSDPWTSGFYVTHSPDFHLWKPIFHEGEIVCFACGHIHNTDVGGMVPASLSRSCTEAFQEGIRIPPQKLYSAGVLNEDLVNIIKSNVRIPEQNWGDTKALVAALNTGERKTHEMITKFGLATFKEGIYDLLNYTEERTRALIAQIPDGEYFFADYIDDDAVSDMPCRLAITMKIKGDELYLDFTGSDPQVTSSYNVPTGGQEHHTLPAVALFHHFVTNDPNMPLNGALMRPIRSILPPGSIMNPEYPAAVGMRSLTVLRIKDVVLGCLAQALPETTPAAAAGGVSIMVVALTDSKTGKRHVSVLQPMLGGGGGTPYHDGVAASGGFMTFLSNTPVEINEAEVPVKILRYDLVPDSGGPGKYRGGLANLLEFQVFDPNSSVTARNRDRTRFRPWGVQGGKAGIPSRFTLNPGTDKERDLGNLDFVRLEPGDIVSIRTPGGAGWGNPLERDPEAVLADIKAGFVSPAAAREQYGVVMGNGSLNLEATEKLRADLSSTQKLSSFDLGPEREEYESVWSQPMYDALIDLTMGLPTSLRAYAKKEIWEKIKRLSKERQVTPDDIRAAWDHTKVALGSGRA